MTGVFRPRYNFASLGSGHFSHATPKAVSADELGLMARMLGDGKTYAEIGDAVGRSRGSVYVILKTRGLLPVRPSAPRRIA